MIEEIEIEKAEQLSSQGDFETALALHREMLPRTRDNQTRMRVLFGIVICSTRLGLNEVTDDAIRALDALPEPKESRLIVDMIKASALIELGKEQDALNLINANLRSGLMATEDFQDLKYEHLFYKGRSLTRLARCNEALEAFDEAHLIHADGKFETDMLIARSNCLMFLKRYEDAYDAAKRVTERDDEDLATLALEYMADCRMMQGRVREALATYIELQRKLPCKHVDEEGVRAGINRAVAYLEKQSSQSKPY